MSVALTCVQQDKPIEEQQDKEKIPQENKILEDAHNVKVDVKVNVVECATALLNVLLINSP